MPEFLTLLPPPEALARLLAHLTVNPIPEIVPVGQALGRVTAAPVIATSTLPSFSRSTVDGYAVRASDTYGASETLPAYLTVVGEVPMGSVPGFGLVPATCALIHTGGMLPDGAEAVVMVENTQAARQGEIEIFRAVAFGENVLAAGEDVTPGQEVISSGTRIRPAEIGGLAALGVTHLLVSRRPQVGILSSGDEVVPLEIELQPGQVHDVNSLAISALVEQTGGLPKIYGIAPDRADELLALAAQAWRECDMVIITAGSSASARDLTAQVISHLGRPGVLVHGVNVRPGKPTILAVCDQKPIIGLPGNPVSALVIAGLFVVPVIDYLLGLRLNRPRPTIPARLTINVPSQAGREDWVAVRLISTTSGYLAEPVYGKSNLIFTLVRADGLVRIQPDATGLEAGTTVDVISL